VLQAGAANFGTIQNTLQAFPEEVCTIEPVRATAHLVQVPELRFRSPERKDFASQTIKGER
jgi:hypothetical protein